MTRGLSGIRPLEIALAIAALAAVSPTIGCSGEIGSGRTIETPGAPDAETPDADEGVTSPDGGVSTDGGDSTTDGGPGVSDADAGTVFDAGPTTVSGLEQRPANASCLAPPRPGGEGLAKAALFPNKNTGEMTDLRRVPAPIGGWILIERQGGIEYIGDDGETQLLGVNLTDLETGNSEQGQLGLAIDPLYPNAEAPNTVRMYLNYTGDCNPCKTLVSRFVLTRQPDGEFSVAPEEVLIRVRQPADNHNGGAMVFGSDNLLYISFGDGGSGNDPWCSAQNPNTPLGKIFRIDVHSTATGYTVPSDNPWYADPQTTTPYSKCDNHVNGPTQRALDESRDDPCPEAIAMGLRNPFRMSFDDERGHLWIGDVGQDVYEEVDHFAPADWLNQARPVNFGWPLREAVRNNGINGACQQLDDLGGLDQTFVAPTYYYDQSNGGGRSVAGGVVYRGSELDATYYGRYFFADVLTGNVWFMENPYDAEAVDVTDQQEDTLSYSFPYGFVEDENKEIIALVGDFRERRLLSATPGVPLPALLSGTGCVNPIDPSEPSSGLIPYGTDVQLWSDGAVKARYLGLPDGTQVAVNADGDLDLPNGTVVLKVFRTPDESRLLETRLMVRHDDGGWAGYTYVWRDDQSDADLAVGETLAPGVDWIAPSRTQCLNCHTDAAGGSLGLELAQLNNDFAYASTGRTANQIDTWNAIGLFADGPVNKGDWLPLSADWPRGYLHSNCSNCHRPDTPTPSNIDLRFSTPFADMGICDETPTRDEEADLRLLAPGAPDQSLISRRPKDLGSGRMPPLATRQVDTTAVERIDDWIRDVTSCP